MTVFAPVRCTHGPFAANRFRRSRWRASVGADPTRGPSTSHSLLLSACLAAAWATGVAHRADVPRFAFLVDAETLTWRTP